MLTIEENDLFPMISCFPTHVAVQPFFYIMSSIAMASSLMCVFCSTYLTMWGPGLALRGDDGAMERAVEGMMKEGRKVVYCVCTVSTFMYCAPRNVIHIVDYYYFPLRRLLGPNRLLWDSHFV